MLRLTITANGTEIDYTKYVDWKTIQIQEQINVPSVCRFTMTPSDMVFKAPVQRSYVTIYSTQYQRSLFTGYISSEPTRTYVSKASFIGTQTFNQQLMSFAVIATSDEYLIGLKAIPFIPQYINQSQGAILGNLANTLCPNFFDTSFVASGDLVPAFQYVPTQSWSETAKSFGDGSRYRYKVRDKQIFYQPYGDAPLGISYDELTQNQSQFDPKGLQTTVLNVPLVNDVTIIGQAEAGNSHVDYFLGDGFTGNFPLYYKTFQGASSLLLNETWTNPQLNTQTWYLPSQTNGGGPLVASNWDFTGGALNLITTGPGSQFPLGQDYMGMNNAIELCGGIDIETGEVVFNDICYGYLGGIYTSQDYTQSELLGGFHISSAGGINKNIPSIIIPGVTGVAAGVSGVLIQPYWNGSGIGPAVVSQFNHSYVLQMLVTAPSYIRYQQFFRTREGEQFGGASGAVLGNITWNIQDFDIAAATGFFYTPDIISATLLNVTLPPVCAFAVVNNQQLNITLSNTTLAFMPLGSLQANIGPSGLYMPTGLILPMLPSQEVMNINAHDSGSTTYAGPVTGWLNNYLASGASGQVYYPAGELQGWQVEVLGNGFELQAAQIMAGNDSDTLQFYSNSLPAAGTPIRLQMWESQAAISRLQVQSSITAEAALVGDNGIRSAIITDLKPLPRTSEDCDNAALAYLQDAVNTFYNGTYTCTSLFFKGLSSDQQFYPCCGRFLNVNAPARGINKQKFLVTGLTISVLDAPTELLQYQIAFGADLYLEKVLANFNDLLPLNVLTPTDTANPPNPRYSTQVTDAFLPDITNALADPITDKSLLVNFYNNYQFPVEVRDADYGWGLPAVTGNLLGTFTPNNGLSLQRLNYDQTWYMRYSLGGITSRKSRVMRVRYPTTPSTPLFMGGTLATNVNSGTLQFNFSGDIRSIYGLEIRAADNVTVLVQKPVASIGDLLIDFTYTPYGRLVPASLQDQLFVYFFNQQWSYSLPLVLDVSTFLTANPGSNYNQAVVSPGGIATIDLSLGLQQEVLLNIPSTYIAYPTNVFGWPTFTLVLIQDSVGGRNIVFDPGYLGVDPNGFDTTPSMSTILQFMFRKLKLGFGGYNTQLLLSSTPTSFGPIVTP